MKKSQINKKIMCQNVKNLLSTSGDKKSLMYLAPEVLMKCINDGTLKDISSQYNHAYQICIGEKLLNIAVLEVLPNYFKVIPAGVIWEVLRNYEWRYYVGEVCTLISSKDTKNPKFKIELAIGNLLKGNETFAKTNLRIHHKWFRVVAIKETVVLLPDKTHKAWHRLEGQYARNQTIRIMKEEDFFQFVGELLRVKAILAEKQFGLEF